MGLWDFFVTFSLWEMGLYKEECKLIWGVRSMQKHEDHENYTFFFKELLWFFFFFFLMHLNIFLGLALILCPA